MLNQPRKIFKTHTRINNGLIGTLEKRSLQWLARRMPGWVTPDILTGVGLFATVLIFYSYWFSNFHPGYLWLASFGFLLNWFGDSLDGTLARHRQIERPRFGFYIDHTVDAMGQILIIFGLGISPYVTFRIALLAVIGYLLLSVHVYIRTYVRGVFQISYCQIGPTEVRAIFVLLNIVMFFLETPRIELWTISFTLYDILLLAGTGIMMLFFLIYSINDLIKLYRSDTKQE
jgi:archaetidylinositol phosphate synthase